ncbi:MAG TPA: SpoIIE family protein phosphatase [Verrucomicrobiae bacterium]|nr:SpoIIE family protein phosphatase [Verrucomicrobiae bacterium]
MSPVPSAALQTFRPRLLQRRGRLESALKSISAPDIEQLIAEVDAALARIDNGSFGLCETCHDTIEADRLAQDPLVRFCLDHLSEPELRAHEQDLELAMQIQSRLLPRRGIELAQWDTHYRYQPRGAVGGDYCDLIVSNDGASLFFAVGDVAGKGVAASLLMTHLSAIFRSLLSLDLPLAEVISRANRLFCESTTDTQYATLACGRVTADGVEVSNAGHCPPLLLRRQATERLEATGLPLGLFCGSQYAVRRAALDAGESLVLYTDGITEAQDPAGDDYGEQRLLGCLRGCFDSEAAAIADGVLADVARFRGTRPPADDLTLLIIRRRR